MTASGTLNGYLHLTNFVWKTQVSSKSISAFPWETEVSSLNSVNVVACSRAQKQRIVHSLTDLRVLSTGTSLFVIDSVIRESFVVCQ